MGILKREHTLKSSQTPLRYYRRHVHDLSHNYILTNDNYDAAVNRTRDLIVRGT